MAGPGPSCPSEARAWKECTQGGSLSQLTAMGSVAYHSVTACAPGPRSRPLAMVTFLAAPPVLQSVQLR